MGSNNNIWQKKDRITAIEHSEYNNKQANMDVV